MLTPTIACTLALSPHFASALPPSDRPLPPHLPRTWPGVVDLLHLPRGCRHPAAAGAVATHQQHRQPYGELRLPAGVSSSPEPGAPPTAGAPTAGARTAVPGRGRCPRPSRRAAGPRAAASIVPSAIAPTGRTAGCTSLTGSTATSRSDTTASGSVSRGLLAGGARQRRLPLSSLFLGPERLWALGLSWGFGWRPLFSCFGAPRGFGHWGFIGAVVLNGSGPAPAPAPAPTPRTGLPPRLPPVWPACPRSLPRTACARGIEDTTPPLAPSANAPAPLPARPSLRPQFGRAASCRRRCTRTSSITTTKPGATTSGCRYPHEPPFTMRPPKKSSPAASAARGARRAPRAARPARGGAKNASVMQPVGRRRRRRVASA
jgi:hypothetical protein